MPKTSIKGYKRNSPDKKEPLLRIASNSITMKNVPFPVMAYPDNDEPMLMYPEEEYYFPNSKQVIEEPVMKKGGKVNKLGVENSLWNNIRANKGSGKKPTKEMLEQEKKISKKQMGGNTPQNFISDLYNDIYENSQPIESNNSVNSFNPATQFNSVFGQQPRLPNLMLQGINTVTAPTDKPKPVTVPKKQIDPLEPKPRTKPRTKQDVNKVTNENIMLPTIINGALGALNQAIQPKTPNMSEMALIRDAQTKLNPQGYSQYGNKYFMQFGGTFLNNVGAEELAPQTELPMFEQPLPVNESSNTSQNVSLELGEDLQNLDVSSKGTDISTRNNNPGNIVFGKFAEKFGAVRGDKQKTIGDRKYTGSSSYAKFPTVGAGIEAMKSLLLTSKYQNLEVDEAMNLWIMGDKNEQGAYSKIAKSKFGSKKLKEVTENPQEFKELIKLMVKGESGAMYNVLKKNFKEGGEYTLSENEIQQILNNGGEIEYLD
jgi:hypothetical protein